MLIVFMYTIILRKMAKNSQTPCQLRRFEAPVKLVGKNWWLLVGLAIAGYAEGGW